MSNTKNTIEEIIKLWKELKIQQVEFQFSCGGDSMNDTTLIIVGEKDNIDNSVISNYFEDEVYNRVEFYEASDGHYQGETGTVYITLEDNEDDFHYNKWSESEWCERHSGQIELELSKEEADFVRDKVLNINGSDGDFTLNYKVDCILSDREEKLVESIEEKILNGCRDFEPEDYEGELNDFYTFTTNEEGEITLLGNNLLLNIENEVTVFREND